MQYNMLRVKCDLPQSRHRSIYQDRQYYNRSIVFKIL
jgi:hypothetical protein